MFLSSLLTHIFEGYVEFVANLITDFATDANTARFGKAFQSGGDIDAISMDVLSPR